MKNLKKYISLVLIWLLIFNLISPNISFIFSNNFKEVNAASATTFENPGSYQYTVPVSGYYSLETWGASGGGNNYGYESSGGLGGYSYGKKYLNKGENLYVIVGEQGKYSSNVGTGGGYNGGGQGGPGGFGGGGMTHISTTNNVATSNINESKTSYPISLISVQVNYYWTTVLTYVADKNQVITWESTGTNYRKGKDPRGRILINGVEIAIDDDSGDGYNFRLSASVNAGDTVTLETIDYDTNYSWVHNCVLTGASRGSTSYSSTGSWNSNGTIIVAGGGGGADNTAYTGSVKGGADDGSGGSGGGTNGGNGSIDGIVQNRGNYNASAVNGGGCGSGGTQTTGYRQGSGESVTLATDTGGGGGGWFGGYVTNHNNGGAGGGSGYIGGVLEGRMQNGVQYGNGKAVITLLNNAPVINNILASSAIINGDSLSLTINTNLTDVDGDKISIFYSYDKTNWTSFRNNIVINNTTGNSFTLQLKHSDFINGKNIYFKINDGTVDSNIYTFNYTPISKTSTLNTLNLNEKYRGALYFGNTVQDTINYGNIQGNPNFKIETNRTLLKTIKYYLNDSLLSTETNKTINGELKKDIHSLFTNNLFDGRAVFNIELTDSNNYIEKLTINVDKNSNILTLRKNSKPNIVLFNLPSNKYTLKNIYDKLMINQTESDMPIFEWNVNSGSNDQTYGDEIQNVKILYSIDEINWNYITNNDLKSQNTFNWLNTLGIDNTKVLFKLIVTDSFGDVSEQILNNNYYLQINDKPNAPLFLTINNLTSNKLFKNNSYDFEWGIATETDVTDEITNYILGFKTGTSENGKDDYNNYKIIYEGLNRFYTLTESDWNKYEDLSNNDSLDLTFGVWAVDKFNTKSLIKTLNISTLNNQPPNIIKKSEISVKDKSFNSIDKNYIKRNEIYTMNWIDKGDPNNGDKIVRWNIQYSLDNLNWNNLNTTTVNYVDFSIDSKLNETNKVYFKIIPYDNYGLSSESEVFEYNFVTDINPPIWINTNDYTLNESDENGQTLSFKIQDMSGISNIQIKDSSLMVIENKDYINNEKNITFQTTLNKNGSYILTLTDIYSNTISKNFTVNTIDNIAPTIKIVSENTNKTNKDVLVKYNIVDDINVLSYKIYLSDFDGNILKEEEYKNISQKNIEKNYTINQNCILTIEAFDKAKNKTTENIKISNINKENVKIVTDYNKDTYADMQSNFNVSLNNETLSNLNNYKNLINDTNSEIVKMIDKDNYKYIIIGSNDELSNININNIDSIDDFNIEYWKIKSINSSYSIVYDNLTKNIKFTVNTNNTDYIINFHDAWGNEDNLNISVKNIIDGQIDINTKYLVSYQDYHTLHPEQGDIQGIYINSKILSNELKEKGYINPNIFIEISKNETKNYQIVYGYLEINENYRNISETNNYSNNNSIEILENMNGKPYSAMCKFTSTNKTVSFYIKDVLNHYIIKRLSIDDIQSEKSAKISIYPETTKTINTDINVLFTVDDGYFKNNDLFYQYQKNNDDGEIITGNYYDDFVWYIPRFENSEYPTNPNYDNLIKNNDSYYVIYNGNLEDLNEDTRIAFTYKFTKNLPFKVWAVNKSGDWIYKYFVLTNIDKEKPKIVIDNYDINNTYPNSYTLIAYTNDEFYTKEEILEQYKNSNDENLKNSLNNYELSNDKKTVKIVFDKPQYITYNFKLFAKDLANNIGESINIDLTKIYKNTLEYNYYYKFSDSENYELINYDDLLKIKTNKNIDIKIKVNGNNEFYSADVLYPVSINDKIVILSGLENTIKYTLTKNNSIVSKIKDENGNLIDKTFIFNDLIDKNKPKLDIIKTSILDSNNKYISSYKITLSSDKIVKVKIINNSDNEIVFENDNYIKQNIATINDNGQYTCFYEDEYGNTDSQNILIENILNQDTKVVINNTISNKKYTNTDIYVTFNISNGYISNFTQENDNLKIIEKNDSKIQYLVKENINELFVEAVNYINVDNKEKSTIDIHNIDKIAPNVPNIKNYINNQGYNSFIINDNGDDGIGTELFNYSYNINQSNEINGELNIKNNILNIDSSNIYDKGNLNLSITAQDAAGNISSPSNATVKSNDTQIFEINTNFNNMVQDLSKNELNESKIIFYNQYINDLEDEINDNFTYINTEQREYALQKINDFKTLLGGLEVTNDEIINQIKEYFNRLDKDIYDNQFMTELQILINKISDNYLKQSYQDTYNYYKDLINNIFVDNTNSEFNYKDENGNILNPLSGYLKNKECIYGYYDKDGKFIYGKNNQLYYYNYEGKLIQLKANTYIDGNNNEVNILNGKINDNKYYDETGKLIDYQKYIKGFYDFNCIWHDLGSKTPIKNPIYDNDDSGEPNNPDDGKIYPKSISFTYTQLELYKGDKINLSINIAPKDVTEKTLTWKSDNSSVVTVNNGKIEAIEEGTATITVTTINNLSANLNIIVSNKGSNTEEEKVIHVTPKNDYPNINELLEEVDEETKEDIEVPTYEEEDIGNIKFAYIYDKDLSLSEYKGIYKEGYSTVIIDTDNNIDPKNSIGSNINVGSGNNNYMAIMSKEDIKYDMEIETFKVKINSEKITLKINSKYNVKRLGLNSYILIISKNKDLNVTYNGNVINSIYDETLKGYIVKNPLEGTYKLEKKSENYGVSDDNQIITYKNLIKIAYNILNKDDYNTLYSNISESSDVYREASTLQKYGILGKDINVTDSVINGEKAFDILYLTLSNTENIELNYENSNFINLSQISLNDVKNMINTIKNNNNK